MNCLEYSEFKKIKKVYYLHLFLFLYFFLMTSSGRNISGVIFELLIILSFQKLYINILNNLRYSLIPFAFSWLLYLFIKVFSVQSILQGTLGLFSILLMLVFLYMLSSPAFYPLVFWWEYDFRYRNDLKVFVLVNGKKLEARLSDLRRGAASLICFNDINDKNLKIEVPHLGKTFEVRVFTIRERLAGRGNVYGVKFMVDNSLIASDVQSLSKNWKENYINKKKIKLKNERTNT